MNEMEKNIVSKIKQLNSTPKLYREVNKTAMKNLFATLPKKYSYHKCFLNNFERFHNNEFDYYPNTNPLKKQNNQTPAGIHSGHNLNTSCIS